MDIDSVPEPFRSSIETCVREIDRTAMQMGLDYLRSNIDFVFDPGLGYLVMLTKFNPKPIFDEEGKLVLETDGSRKVGYKYPMFVEYMYKTFSPESSISPIAHFSVSARISIPVPQLVRIVRLDGSIVRR